MGLKYLINHLGQETILFRKFNLKQKPEHFLNDLTTGKKAVQLSKSVYAEKHFVVVVFLVRLAGPENKELEC